MSLLPGINDQDTSSGDTEYNFNEMKQIASFEYKYLVQAGGNSRDAVKIRVDFTPVYLANPDTQIILDFVMLSGTRQNVSGTSDIMEALASRLIGNFNSDNLATSMVITPRGGDSVSGFRGLAFSNTTNFNSNARSSILIPRSFDIEFIPSNRSGVVINDNLNIFVSIGFIIGPEL